MDANRRRGEAAVRSRDGDRGPARPRAGDAAVPGAGAAVVAGRDDRQHVEVGRPGDGPRERAVRERGVRLDHADERDAGGVVGVAVVVRIDRGLEPGEDLVGPGVDAVPALRVRLPARDAHGRIEAPGAIPWSPPGPSDPGDDPGELGRMALGPAGDRRMRLGDRHRSRG